MTGNNYNIRDFKSQHLKNIYKKYTDNIINFERHIKKIFDDWIIDINNRNYVLQRLDTMIRSMIKIYNSSLMKIYKQYPYNDESEQYSTENENNQVININKTIKNKLEILDYIDNPVNHNIINDPFDEIRQELLLLCQDNGFSSMDDFLKFYINDEYRSFFGKNFMESFELYNKVFIPLSIKIDHHLKKKKKNKNINFIIKKASIQCDSLIDNVCDITIIINNIPLKIVFEGYVSADLLNAYLRTSQIYSRHLFNIRNETRNNQIMK